MMDDLSLIKIFLLDPNKNNQIWALSIKRLKIMMMSTHIVTPTSAIKLTINTHIKKCIALEENRLDENFLNNLQNFSMGISSLWNSMTMFNINKRLECMNKILFDMLISSKDNNLLDSQLKSDIYKVGVMLMNRVMHNRKVSSDDLEYIYQTYYSLVSCQTNLLSILNEGLKNKIYILTDEIE